MTAQLMTAISNRDGDALARMAAGSTEPQRLLDFEAERLVDSLFRQLKQIFPASTQTNLRTDAEEKTAKRQWIAAFAENGIRTREQLSAGVRHARASESPFWPSPPVHQVVQGQRHCARCDPCRRDERVPPLQP